MTSTLYLYRDSKIIPSRNFVVDDIETYLATLTKSTITDFQYLRNDLNLSIKINKTQTFTDITLDNNFNYVKVVQNGCNYYYFLIKKTQVSQTTIVLDLVMDTANTFKYNVDFSVLNKTKVLREHKDRFTLETHVKEKQLTANRFQSEGGLQWFPYLITRHASDYSLSEISLEDFVFTNVTSGVVTDTEFVVQEVGQDRVLFAKVYFTGTASEGATLTCNLYSSGLKNKVDLYSEGLNPILYKEDKGVLNNSVPLLWYLIYKTNPLATEQDPKAVNCFIAPSQQVKGKIYDEVLINGSSLESGKDYTFGTGSPTKVIFSGGEFATGYNVISPWEVQFYGFVLRQSTGDTSKVNLYTMVWKYVVVAGITSVTSAVLGTYENLSQVELNSESPTILCHKDTSIPSDIREMTYNEEITKLATSYTLKTFDEIDRTDAKLIKIICLPYLPTDYNVVSDIINFGNEWEYDAEEGLIKLKDLNTLFNSKIETEISNPLYEIFYPHHENMSASQSRFLKDPKLYHSDYYQPKFVYDSFGFVFQAEKVNPASEFSPTFSFNFVMTTTIRSRFMFKFEEYNLLYSTSDYDNILSIARNNEAVIYNSNYLTYLRTGYNIDVKAKERTQNLAVAGAIVGSVGAIADTTLGFMKGNTLKATTNAVGNASGVATSIINSVNTIASSEESLQKKLNTLKEQAVSVEGSDDLDLLINYSDNKAKLVIYKVSPRINQALDDLFYYTGYISNELKVPVVNTRYWFNFLSCELEFVGTGKNLSEFVINDLKSRYKEGITFLHNHGGNWDFAQEKENWEVSVLS